MAENSGIEWTDHTVNVWWGCQKVSTGCKFCYADDVAKRFGDNIWGEGKPRRYIKSALSDIRRYDRKAREAGRHDRVFMHSMSDFFETDSGQPIINDKGQQLFCETEGEFGLRVNEPLTLTALRETAFAEMEKCTNLIFMLLTKRPENIRRMWRFKESEGPWGVEPCFHSFTETELGYLPYEAWHRHNIWLGTSIENQEQAEKRIPELLKCRDLSPVLFLSCEPLLGPLDLTFVDSGGVVNCLKGTQEEDAYFCDQQTTNVVPGPKVDWIIAGGESGPNARPSHPNWFRSLRNQCVTAGTPFLFKQWGEWAPGNYGPGGDLYERDRSKIESGMFDYCGHFNGGGPNPFRQTMDRIGKKKAGRLLDDQEWNQFPQVPSAHQQHFT